jgi:hypothetical protein
MIGSSGLGSGSQCIMNLSTYVYSLNASPCSIVVTDDGNFGCSFAINQKTKGAITNSIY